MINNTRFCCKTKIRLVNSQMGRFCTQFVLWPASGTQTCGIEANEKGKLERLP